MEKIIRTVSGSKFGSALLAAGLTALPTLALCFLALRVVENYGLALFIGVPLISGFLSAFLFSFYEERSFRASQGAAWLSICLVAVAILVFAMEGLICILMALPLALVLASLGSWIGGLCSRAVRSRRARGILNLLLLGLCPLCMGLEANLQRKGELFRVHSAVEVNASPERVWKYIPAMPVITAQPDLVFRLGIACPMTSTIDGNGTGARRQCVLTTGAMEEVVTEWKENEVLRFRVLSTPPPMKELSPYAGLKVAHLDQFYRCEMGEFRLVRLPDGRTRIEGTSWYAHDIWPGEYWRQISDYIVHKVHYRVMNHIKALAEAEPRTPGLRE